MPTSLTLPKIERKLTIRSDDPFASMFLDNKKHLLIGDRGMRNLIDQQEDLSPAKQIIRNKSNLMMSSLKNDL